MTPTRPASVALAVVATLSLGACADNKQGESTTDHNRSIAATPRGDSPEEIELADFEFKPSSITTEAGDTLQMNLRNSGKAPHTFTIRELNVNQEVQPGNNSRITFTAARAGEFKIICTYHEAQGMVATLTAN